MAKVLIQGKFTIIDSEFDKWNVEIVHSMLGCPLTSSQNSLDLPEWANFSTPLISAVH